MRPSLRFATMVCRSWTALYTFGLDDVTRERRRAEIDSDLWEHQADSNESDADTAFEITTRVILGMGADLSWRYHSPGRSIVSGDQRHGGRAMLNKLFTTLTCAVTIFAGLFFIYVAFGRTGDGAEGFAAPFLGAGLALLGGSLAAFWSPRIGTSLVAAGSFLVVFMFPWMAGATLPIAILLTWGTSARGRGPRAVAS